MLLCPHNCNISPDNTGICKVRKNINGTLYSLNYGKISSIAMDPIEKKPFKQYFPGNTVLSVGSFGCNLKCSFCQNWSIAHGTPPTENIDLNFMVKAIQSHNNCIGMAFTYNEPSIWYEYVLDTAKEINKLGFKNILVTNGYINPEPLESLLPYINAVNVDLKAFTNDYYKRVCGGNLESVKKTIEILNKNCHVEVTTLLVTGLNDTPEEINELSSWLAGVDSDIPLHLTKYFPNYKMLNGLPTPLETMHKAKETAENT